MPAVVPDTDRDVGSCRLSLNTSQAYNLCHLALQCSTICCVACCARIKKDTQRIDREYLTRIWGLFGTYEKLW